MTKEQQTTRWFVTHTTSEFPVLLFKTNWTENRIHSELVWNNAKRQWQASRIIFEHFLMPDINIEEVTRKFAQDFAPEAFDSTGPSEPI